MMTLSASAGRRGIQIFVEEEGGGPCRRKDEKTRRRGRGDNWRREESCTIRKKKQEQVMEGENGRQGCVEKKHGTLGERGHGL